MHHRLLQDELTLSQHGYLFEYARSPADEGGYVPGRWPGGHDPRNLLYMRWSWISGPNMKPIADIIESYSYQGLYQLNEGCISHLMPRLIVEHRRSEPRQKPKQCRSGRLVGTNSNWGNDIGKYWGQIRHTGIRQKSAVHFAGVGRSMMLEWSSLRDEMMNWDCVWRVEGWRWGTAQCLSRRSLEVLSAIHTLCIY